MYIFFNFTKKILIFFVKLIIIFFVKLIDFFQFAFLAKEDEELTGSKDLCYHNFKCQRPFWIFSDFNHVISNMSYWLFGLAFMVIVYYKSKLLPQSHDPKVGETKKVRYFQKKNSLFGELF